MSYPPIGLTLGRIVVDLRRWYVASRSELTVDEAEAFRKATEALSVLAAALVKRSNYQRRR